jgi:transcriptional regulator with XRE-family HTH domain
MYEDDSELETVRITDEAGREITCTVEHSMEIEDQDYVLLLPVDAPVEIFVWKETGDEEEAVPIEDEAEIDRLFPIAKAVLEELNLTLKRTAVTLTVEGALPDLEEEEEYENDEDSGSDEELQRLASFYADDEEYGIYAPLDPFFILARMDEQDQPHLLSAEELKKIEPLLPMLEEQLFEQLED